MIHSKQKVSIAISSPANEVWDIISALTGVENWLAPMITGSRLEGDKRVCTTEGGEFEEDILEVNHSTKTFRYGIPKQHMIPVEDILGTMHVRNGTDGGSVVDWTWTFQVAEKNEEQAKGMLAHAGDAGINGIDALIQSKNQVAN